MKDLLKSLIQADTTCANGEVAAAQILYDHLKNNGIDSELSYWGQTRANIFAHIKSTGQNPALLFACHLDVVPPGEGDWKHPPFSAIEENEKIYGRGAADMKGSIAALITAIEQIVSSGSELRGDIIFTAVAGEETDSCGIKRFVKDYKTSLPDLAGIIVAEPTNFEVITAHRGLLWLEIITKGKTAHGSMPHLGINAIKSMRTFLDQLEKINLSVDTHPLLGNCSMSINTIEAGKAINVVPDLCSAQIDIRTLPDQNHSALIEQLKSIFVNLKKVNPDFDAHIKIIRDVEALETDNNCDFVKNFCSVVDCDETITAGFCTDGPFITSLGAPIVIFGPGHGELCHKPDEYIEIADLQKAVEVYKKIITEFNR